MNETSSKLCLITDDSPVIRKVIRRILKGLDFEIDEAEHGVIALEKCAVRMPDIVLLDWNMPVMNGIEFLRELREKYDRNATKVVFCTTESGVAHIREAMDAGADDYIIKPFDGPMLLAKFDSVCTSSN